MQARTGTPPWRAQPKTNHKYVCPGKSRKADDVISRDEFLAARVRSLQTQQAQSPPSYRLWTEKSAIVEKSARAAIVAPNSNRQLPPGLELPPGLPLPPSDNAPAKTVESTPLPEKQPVAPVAEPEQFKVLLQNMPQAMLKECMLRAMLEQAKLTDVIDCAFRPNGKALVSFKSSDSVCKCISHFQGRKWGNSAEPVTATYVKTVKKVHSIKAPAVKDVSTKPQAFAAKPRTLSAGAPSFVPGCFQFKLDAPAFKGRDRCYSYASTGIPESESCESEVDEQVMCT